MSIELQQRLFAGRGTSSIYAVCSAHPWVIEAAARQALEDGTHLLLEATSNQVNQDGGYTGMLPADFIRFASNIAARAGLPRERLLFGGDHLGPNPWGSLPAAEAMKRASHMVDLYARAGFTKIHLDTSMACSDDPEHLGDQVVAERAAQLCAVAETASTAVNAPPIYVIGTEVPPPGGASHALAQVQVTEPEAVERTLHVHESAFRRAGLVEAWKRVTAIVVQPGVEFDHARVFDYSPSAARKLQSFLHNHSDIVFEAHSTDYQTASAYRELVRDGFAILKVGPALTFAMREALFALAAMENEVFPSSEQSLLRLVLERAMINRPKYWERYYCGTPEEVRLMRSFSYSDRIRYYWPDADVQGSVQRLLSNLDRIEVPETLVSQYLPAAYQAMRCGKQASAKDIIIFQIRLELQKYSAACSPASLSAARGLQP